MRKNEINEIQYTELKTRVEEYRKLYNKEAYRDYYEMISGNPWWYGAGANPFRFYTIEIFEVGPFEWFKQLTKRWKPKKSLFPEKTQEEKLEILNELNSLEGQLLSMATTYNDMDEPFNLGQVCCVLRNALRQELVNQGFIKGC